MDRIKIGKYELEPPKLVELPKCGPDLGNSHPVAPAKPPSSWRGPGPHADRAGPTPPDSAAGFYCFGARRYAEPDLDMWRSVGPGWAIAWAIAGVFAALLVINLLASVVP